MTKSFLSYPLCGALPKNLAGMTKQQNPHVKMHFKPEAITNGVLNKKNKVQVGEIVGRKGDCRYMDNMKYVADYLKKAAWSKEKIFALIHLCRET